MGNIALVDDEDAFINTHSRPITDSEGMVFTSNDYHTIDGTFTKMTNTFEAWVKFPQNYPKNIRGGIMLSNSGNARSNITYQILANGKPSVSTTKYSYGTSKGSETRTFDQVNVYNGEWTHLAIVNDQANNTITCYVNGVAAQTLEGALADSINTVAAGVLGGNFSPGNPLAFRGEMKEVALYSDVRTADEIKADMNAVGADDLMAHWDLSKDAVNGKIIDESGNNHDVTLGKVWFDSDVDPDDYDYSFAIVGDTQYVNYNWNDRYDDIYDWLVENKDTKKIKYVMNMGDITENSADAQWERAATEHAKLDAAKIPYSLVRGNHDKSAGFNTAFNKAPYINSYAESFDEKIENTYRELTVGNIKYLIFTLDIGASDEVLEWAGNVVEAHPYHNVIFTTHVYLDKNGVPMNSSYNGASTNSTYGGGGNDADEMWDKLFGKYENVVMVLCGHVSAEMAVRTERIGVNGNVVTQMMVDPQGTDNSIGATGMVTMLNFSNNGKNINVETYSTVREKHYKTQGQYDFEIDAIKYPAAFQSASLTLDNSTAVNFKANAENLADFSNIYATFDLEGVDGSVKVNASQPDDKGMLVFTYDDIPAEMMGNTITATIHATKDGKEHTTSTTYSVEQYCYNKLKKYAPYVEGSEYSEEDIEYATSLKTLIVDLLNYGSAVQSYTGTDAENLVNGDLTEAEKAFANAHVPEMNGLRAIYNNLENETIRWSAGNLVFHNNVQLKFNFKFVDGKTADTSNYKVVIANDLEGTDVVATIGATEFKSEDGEYVVYYKGFDATEMDRNIYMTVFDGSTQVSDTFAYSISAYARQKYTPDDATNALSNAVLAMMRYGDAAEAHEIWRGYVA
ncbi:MAG: metallophosphoesterase [Oscillospiraceae bacterium]|nr:metallophosphoesterase [Oscillospiraceae bacterium]